MKKSEASGKSPWILASLLQSNSSIKNIDKETYGGYSHEEMEEAIRFIDGRAEIEVSGNVTKDNISKFVDLGVSCISSGALTHSAPIMDISLKNLHAI